MLTFQRAMCQRYQYEWERLAAARKENIQFSCLSCHQGPSPHSLVLHRHPSSPSILNYSLMIHSLNFWWFMKRDLCLELSSVSSSSSYLFEILHLPISQILQGQRGVSSVGMWVWTLLFWLKKGRGTSVFSANVHWSPLSPEVTFCYSFSYWVVESWWSRRVWHPVTRCFPGKLQLSARSGGLVWPDSPPGLARLVYCLHLGDKCVLVSGPWLDDRKG